MLFININRILFEIQLPLWYKLLVNTIGYIHNETY